MTHPSLQIAFGLASVSAVSVTVTVVWCALFEWITGLPIEDPETAYYSEGRLAVWVCKAATVVAIVSGIGCTLAFAYIGLTVLFPQLPT